MELLQSSSILWAITPSSYSSKILESFSFSQALPQFIQEDVGTCGVICGDSLTDLKNWISTIKVNFLFSEEIIGVPQYLGVPLILFPPRLCWTSLVG